MAETLADFLADLLAGHEHVRSIGLPKSSAACAIGDGLRRMVTGRRVSGLEDGRGLTRHPDWQVMDVFGVFGDSSWAVYRFLLPPHPALGGAPPPWAFRAGAVAR